MIWHIFKKDVYLLWPFVVIVALLHAVNAYLWVTLGHFYEPVDLRMLASTLPMIVLLGTAVVVAVAVQED
ncbi:MAG TPA: hypothetical protein VET48_07290, partial [Steroidobacteraceae bacterium]|nr:hypothetical protein [Steroidobacteraceae bacterium]